MAQIQIQLSQEVVDGNGALALVTQAPSNGLVGAAFDTLISVGSAVARTYVDYKTATLNGSTLTLTFPDGATITYRDLVKANPNAQSGLMHAGQFDFVRDGTLEFSQKGAFTLAYQYLQGANGSETLAMASLGGTAESARLVSDYETTSTRYNPYLGNVGMSMVGTVGSDTAGKLYGNVSELRHWADKLFSTITVTGNLSLSGDHAAVSSGAGHVAVTGTVTGYAKGYYDGSYERYAGMDMALGTGEQFNLSLLGNPANFPADDIFDIRLPLRPAAEVRVMAGEGHDRLALHGGGGALNANGGAGNDRFLSGQGGHDIDGGAGVDTVQYAALRAQGSYSGSPATMLIVNKPAQDGIGFDILRNVERIEWADRAVAFDIDGTAGQAYRVYQAAFDRQPDLEGLSFWLHRLDEGVSLVAVAAGFVASAEFKSLYGENPSDATFLTRLYQNVLHRPYDQAGFDFWMGALKMGYGREVLLAQFSESPENQAQVIGAIQAGIEFIPLGTLQI